MFPFVGTRIFEEATKLLSGDKYVTLTLVMPAFIELFSYIESVMVKAVVSNSVKEALTQSHSVLFKYYEFSDDCIFYLAAMILDPQFSTRSTKMFMHSAPKSSTPEMNNIYLFRWNRTPSAHCSGGIAYSSVS
jgi:hypothetical protein